MTRIELGLGIGLGWGWSRSQARVLHSQCAVVTRKRCGDDDDGGDAIRTRGRAPPELVVFLEVEHELPCFAEVVLLFIKVWALGVHRTLYILCHVRSRCITTRRETRRRGYTLVESPRRRRVSRRGCCSCGHVKGMLSERFVDALIGVSGAENTAGSARW